MFDDLFDSPWKILIVAVVVIVLFGSKKLPDAARSLGRSMRILKTELQARDDDEPAAPPGVADSAPAAPAALPASADPQAQIAALQEQINNLQRTVAADGTAAADTSQPR
ncbi:Sec-independent protein translocase subunit TatA [Trebonia sp.]|uniref:Sec-independent protein translocase subunit TatA n=1 Tax=Trebonia sp. TaxID=2767075 RepID=UPI00261D0377|nr:Sec-independent protein translocase subunit TatA [Trebonia sp.]